MGNSPTGGEEVEGTSYGGRSQEYVGMKKRRDSAVKEVA